MKAIQFETTGGPEVLRVVDVELEAPKPGEVQVRVHAAGVNFMDTLFRSGAYPCAPPSGIGVECAGLVAAVGEGVTGFSIGQRVACGTGGLGAYAEFYNVAASRLAAIPDEISFEVAAAVMMKGLTSDYLLNRAAKLTTGSSVLIHAAAGGVGSLACQWAKHLGATVIGVVGSSTKSEAARRFGCDHVVSLDVEDLRSRVTEITAGRGVDVVLDSVGKAVFDASIDSLGRYGRYVSYGHASGAIEPVDPNRLGANALWLTRTSVYTYTGTSEEHAAGAGRLFDVLQSGAVQAHIGEQFPLREAALAHRRLESRETTGSIILIP